MRRALTPHPDSRPPPGLRIDVEIARPGPRALALRYVVTGDMSRVRLPAPAPPARADELWRHTCCEAFVRAAEGDEGEGYVELNFSPSSAWAAYRFDGHRRGMRAIDGVVPPRIAAQSEAERFALEAAADLDGAPLPADGVWRVGLAAVIEDIDGGISYWALAHPSGAPDFHHADGFALALPAPDQPSERP